MMNIREETDIKTKEEVIEEITTFYADLNYKYLEEIIGRTYDASVPSRQEVIDRITQLEHNLQLNSKHYQRIIDKLTIKIENIHRYYQDKRGNK